MRVIERNQWTVYVETTPDGNGGWFLRIEDSRGNFTGWVESFDTEQAAVDAAIEAIDNEGIETFVGPGIDLGIYFDA